MYYQPIILEINKDLNILGKVKDLLNKKDLNKNEILFIEKKENKNSLGIEDTLKVVEWNYYKSDKLRICIILEAEKLTNEAQNSLLKVLEESSFNNLIILQTLNSDYLLQTIKSRCRTINIKEKKEIIFDIKSLVELNYLERERFIDKILKEENSREKINILIIELLKYYIQIYSETKKQNEGLIDVIELLRFCSIANKSNVNTKLLLDNININLDF